MKGVVVSHPTGNRNVRAIVDGLHHNGMLAQFATTIAVSGKEKWLRLLPGNIKGELLRRSYNLPPELIHTSFFLELCRLVLPKIGYKKAVVHERGWASVDAVYRHLDHTVARYLAKAGDENINAVYAYEDGALETFQKAKSLGITCIYDLPIAYWEVLRSLLLAEAERLPEWKVTLGGGIADSTEKLERKTKELELADVVVGPGNFVLNSLPAWAKSKKIIMSPFGTPHVDNTIPSNIDLNANRPLKVLFAGSLGQRKGLGDLFKAVQLLNTSQIELIVMGPLLADLSFYKQQLANFTYEPTRPHHKVMELMRSCDVFCLPSIVEGRALVMQEAMSQGLPIIITPNTGGEDLVIEGETGFLVPIKSPEAIAEKLNWFFENRSQIKAMGTAAQKHAATYTWKAYGEKIVREILELS